MSITLSQDDFQKLVKIILSISDFATESQRRKLVEASFIGVEKSDIIMSQLDLSGSPRMSVTTIILCLCKFGQPEANKEALGIFLNYIKLFVGVEDENFIDEIFSKYPLKGVSKFIKPTNISHGDSIKDINEKIIGENTLRHINFIESIVLASKAIVHINVNFNNETFFGTGFLISSDLIMTNNHVIDSDILASNSIFTFNYQLDMNGNPNKQICAKFKKGGIFYTKPELDFTIIQIDTKVGEQFGYLKLNKSLVKKKDRVSIIQHPNGGYKMISIQNNFVEYSDSKFVQYTTSTLPGSSGSPVLNNNMEVIGIHHQGGMIDEPGSNSQYYRNQGITMFSILEELKNNENNIFKLINL